MSFIGPQLKPPVVWMYLLRMNTNGGGRTGILHVNQHIFRFLVSIEGLRGERRDEQDESGM